MSANLQERFAELPVNLSSHLQLTLVALALGVAISLPLAVFLVRNPRLRYPVLTVVGVVQTIPGLALLALMVPFLVMVNTWGLGVSAFGFLPAVIALTLYSVLPILRNTVTGIVNVDASLTEAARGVGMSERQVLYMVELPLAAPVILAGLRTAAVWTVGTATLATPIGQTCLGNYIFAGLQTRNWLMVMFGVVSAAALAVVLDSLLAGLERAAAERRRGLAAAALAGLFVLVVGGVASPKIAAMFRSAPPPPPRALVDGKQAVDRSTVRIGAKSFTEQYILASAIEQSLQEKGFQTKIVDSLGSAVVFDALVRGDIDVYVDYSGTIWANYMKRSDTPAEWQVMAEVEGWLAADKGIRSLGALGFENAYALAVRRSDAERLHLETISDLAEHASSFGIAGDYEFFGRPEWQELVSGYGLRFESKLTFDPSLLYEALAKKKVDVAAVLSSDGRIAVFDLVVLRDDRSVIPPYDAMLLVGRSAAKRLDLVAALEPLIANIHIETMRAANQAVDRDENKQTATQAAAKLLGEIR